MALKNTQIAIFVPLIFLLVGGAFFFQYKSSRDTAKYLKSLKLSNVRKLAIINPRSGKGRRIKSPSEIHAFIKGARDLEGTFLTNRRNLKPGWEIRLQDEKARLITMRASFSKKEDGRVYFILFRKSGAVTTSLGQMSSKSLYKWCKRNLWVTKKSLLLRKKSTAQKQSKAPTSQRTKAGAK